MKLAGPALATFLLLLAAGGCRERERETFSLGGRTYAFPSVHLTSMSREPHTFVRVKHPDKPYQLVYDSRAQGAQVGPGIPRLFSVNDEGQTGVDYHPREDGIVVCRRAVNPRGGCGLRVRDQGVEWTILFPPSRLGQVDAIEKDALELLARYAG